MPAFEKELMLQEIVGKLGNPPYLFMTKFDRLSANDFASLRRSLEKGAKASMVVKKTLLNKYFKQQNLPELKDGFLDGAVLVVTAEDNPQIVSKTLMDYLKDKGDKLSLLGACVEGQLVKPDYVKELAKLPSRQELIAKVVGGIKAPITGFVLTLRGTVSSVVNVMDQIRKQKESGSSK